MSEQVECCATCRFWGWTATGYTVGQLQNNLAPCKRHAPRLIQITTERVYTPIGHWPTTEGRDGCGDWEYRPGARTEEEKAKF